MENPVNPVYVEKKRTASLEVDAQYCFTPVCPDELPVDDGDNIVDELNLQAALAGWLTGSSEGHSPKAAWVPNAQHNKFDAITDPGLPNIDRCWPKHAEPGTKGFERLAGLSPLNAYQCYIYKGVDPKYHPYTSCYHDAAKKVSTGLIEFLKYHGVTVVIVGGLATNYCVEANVLDLLAAGFVVIVNLGACRGINDGTLESSMYKMKKAGAIFVNSANEIKAN